MNCRLLVAVGAVLCAVGIALAATTPVVGVGDAARSSNVQTIGGVFVLAGWALLAGAIHRLGRSRAE